VFSAWRAFFDRDAALFDAHRNMRQRRCPRSRLIGRDARDDGSAADPGVAAAGRVVRILRTLRVMRLAVRACVMAVRVRGVLNHARYSLMTRGADRHHNDECDRKKAADPTHATSIAIEHKRLFLPNAC
jgi:hypothetical protein